MKGSLPLPYIVGIILAVIVIAILAYMFFTESGIFSSVIDEKYCQAKCFEWCELHQGTTWQQFSSKCASEYPCTCQ